MRCLLFARSSTRICSSLSSITLNSNLASLNAQRRLASSSKGLSDTFVRLSSGLRINRASDDAAGLSISESLNADKRVLAQGVRNLNDGISLLSIADAAVAELSTITIRLSELAEQSATGSLSNVQRSALDEEAQALREEYFRIVQTTEFNGEKLFDGNLTELRLQAGYGSEGAIVSGLGGKIGTGEFGEVISHDAENPADVFESTDFDGDGIADFVTANDSTDVVTVEFGIGDGTFRFGYTFSDFTNPRDITIADINSDGSMDILVVDSSDDTVSSIINNGDGSFSDPSVVASPNGVFAIASGDMNNDGNVDFVSVSSASDGMDVFLGDGSGGFTQSAFFAVGDPPRDVFLNDQDGDGYLDIVTGTADRFVTGLSDGNGGYTYVESGTFSQVQSIASGDFNGDGILDLVGNQIDFGLLSIRLGRTDGTYKQSQAFNFTSQTRSIASGDFNGDGYEDFAVELGLLNEVHIYDGAGDGTFTAGSSFELDGPSYRMLPADFNSDGVLDLLLSDPGDDELDVRLGLTTQGIAPLLAFSLGTQAGARQALPVFQQKLDQLAEQRGQIGAYEARIGAALATTKTTQENYTSAQSRITDADVAEEAARLVRQQILQQAGVAVLSQANQGPALALQLLGQ